MRLSKFVKTAGLALSFVTSASVYADEQIVWLWEVEKAKQLAKKGEQFTCYIQDIHTLMYFLESSDKYTDGTYKISKDCLLEVLESPIDIDVIRKRELDTISLVKVKEVTSALQKIISQKINGLPYIGIPEWNEIVMPCGEFYYITESGYSESVDPKTTEIEKKATAFRSFLPLGSEKGPYVSNDRLMFHEIDQAACNAKISDLLKRLTEVGETDDVLPILYYQEEIEKKLIDLKSHPEWVRTYTQQERRDRSEPSSEVPSRCATPESQEE